MNIKCTFLPVLLLVLVSSFSCADEIRFAYQDRVADAASIVALEEGIFSAAGLQIKRMRFSSGPATSEALYTGAADIGTMGDAAVVISCARNAGLVVLASYGGGEYRHRMISRKGLELKVPSDLKGKTIAVKKGTSTYGGLLAWLARNNMSRSDINLVDMRPGDMIEALSAGSIDVLCASEPTPTLAEVRGGHSFGDLSGLGNNYPILLVARKKYVEGHEEQVVQFLRAMAQAVDRVNRSPEEVSLLLSRVTGMAVELSRQSLANHQFAMTLNDATLNSLNQTGAALADFGAISSAPDIRDSIRTDLLEKALVQ